VIVKNKNSLVAGNGVNQSLISTTTRSDGSLQVTYAGWPLYYFHTETKPLQIFCQGLNRYNGFWWLVYANGEANESKPKA